MAAVDQPCFRSARTRLSSASACVRAAEAGFLLGLGLIERETVRDGRSSPLHGASRLPEVLTDLRLDVRTRSPDVVKHVLIKFEKRATLTMTLEPPLDGDNSTQYSPTEAL